MASIQGFKPGKSPFDRIRQHTEEGEEYWSARDMMVELNYARWEDVELLIGRAKSACRKNGHDVAFNFREHPKVITHPSGRTQVAADVFMTRYGCYLFTLSGNSTKPEIAAAKHYFAYMTRMAETESTVVVQEAPPAIERTWSERFRLSYLDHYRDLQSNFPGSFSVVTATVGPMLFMEDELIRHLFKPSGSDRPDVSIGRHWAVHRGFQGLPPATRFTKLFLPNTVMEVMVAVYGDAERGTFEIWFNQVYLPEKFPNYVGDKRSFNQFGHLPPASVADHVCKGLTGRQANLKLKTRRELDHLGGFAPVGTKAPALDGPDRGQANFLDLFE